MATPHANASGESAVMKYYQEERWDALINLANISIESFANALPHPIFSGNVVFMLYFAAQAYRATDQKDKYAACLKMLYSLEEYSHVVGGKYRELLTNGAEEYRSLAPELGVSYLNELEVKGLFKSKSGCFIATAAFDSPFAPEVVALREFRDDVMSRTTLGRAFIRFYYFVSPPIARFVSFSKMLKTASRAVLSRLVIFLEQRKDSPKNQ